MVSRSRSCGPPTISSLAAARGRTAAFRSCFPSQAEFRGTSFEFEGRQFTLSAGDGIGNTIHGFVIDRPWRVVEQTGTMAVAELQAKEGLSFGHWPADFRIAVAYELVGMR